MATTTLTIPDAKVARVATGLGWPSGAIGAETQAAFLKRRVIELVSAEISQREQNAAVKATPAPAPLDIT